MQQWQDFWQSDSEKAIEMLKDYERPLYIHAGNIRTGINITKFEDKCFEDYVEGKIWKVIC